MVSTSLSLARDDMIERHRRRRLLFFLFFADVAEPFALITYHSGRAIRQKPTTAHSALSSSNKREDHKSLRKEDTTPT